MSVLFWFDSLAHVLGWLLLGLGGSALFVWLAYICLNYIYCRGGHAVLFIQFLREQRKKQKPS